MIFWNLGGAVAIDLHVIAEYNLSGSKIICHQINNQIMNITFILEDNFIRLFYIYIYWTLDV